jgi:hypothetical protein
LLAAALFPAAHEINMPSFHPAVLAGWNRVLKPALFAESNLNYRVP